MTTGGKAPRKNRLRCGGQGCGCYGLEKRFDYDDPPQKGQRVRTDIDSLAF